MEQRTHGGDVSRMKLVAGLNILFRQGQEEFVMVGSVVWAGRQGGGDLGQEKTCTKVAWVRG